MDAVPQEGTVPTTPAAAGYRVVAPDQRGYGGTTRPEAVEDYDISHLTGDMVGLLDLLGEERATFVGHDWGSIVVWQMAVLHPERVEGVCGMSVPFVPRAPAPPLQIFRAIFRDRFFYIVHFQEPGVADAELGADPAKTMRRMLAGLGNPDDLTPDQASAAAADDGRGFVDRIPEPDGLPAWLAQAELDPRGSVIIPGAGHWVQQEAPMPVNAALLGFFDQLRGGTSS